jgi:formate hydrogenlyase subunit 3/multisubunit Na+/H+ antiporter MnhD subunit
MLPALGGLSTLAPLLSGLMWAALLIFRGFPIFIKFFVEWELLGLLISNFQGFGLFFFFIITMFGVLSFSRIWFSILYGHPVDVHYKTDILKRDSVTGYFLVCFLFLLNFFFILFNGWCFVTYFP